jgi:hypothetical protein
MIAGRSTRRASRGRAIGRTVTWAAESAAAFATGRWTFAATPGTFLAIAPTETGTARAASTGSIRRIITGPIAFRDAKLRRGIPALQPRFHFRLRQIQELLTLVVGKRFREESLELLWTDFWIRRCPHPSPKLHRLFKP